MKELWEHKNSERLAAIIIDIYVYGDGTSQQWAEAVNGASV